VRTKGFRGVLLSALLIVSLLALATSLLSVSPSAALEDLTPRAPIYIEGNDDFTAANGVVAGSGTAADPYIIENWDISAENANGIEIRNTTAYFIVRNCLVENGRNRYGIYLYRSSNSTLENNTCSKNGCGIMLYYTYNSTLTNNACDNNLYNFSVMEGYDHDIDNSNLVDGRPIYYLRDRKNEVIGPSLNPGYVGLVRCDNIRVENLLLGNNGEGILLFYTENSRIDNCTFFNNGFGMRLLYSGNNELISNTCDNNDYGIQPESSDNNTLINNTCSNSSYYGIRLWSSDNNALINNTCSNNNDCGIMLVTSSNNTLVNNTCDNNGCGIASNSNNNSIYHNNFINNATQVHDEGSNYWDDGYPSGGNYWSDYAGVDIDNDGIGDTPYIIPSDNNQDRYPLMYPFVPEEVPEEVPTRWPLIAGVVGTIVVIGIVAAVYMRRQKLGGERLKGTLLSALMIASLMLPLLIISAEVAWGQEIGWIRQFGTSAYDYAYGAAVDGKGNVYIAGVTGGRLPGQTRSGGPGDAFVRKYDGSGSEVWTKQFGSPDYDEARSVAVDGKGNVYVAGFTLGAFPGQAYLGEVETDAFVRKYDGSGNEIWTKQFGTSDWDDAQGVAADDEGNVYVAGFTLGALPGQASLGGSSPFVRKYDIAGNELWTRQFGSGHAIGVAVDASGNVYVAGYGEVLPGQTSLDGWSAFVRKYDGSGNEIWTREAGAGGVAVDVSGNVYVAGGTQGALPGQSSSGGLDVFVRKYDSSGNELWTKQFGTSARDEADDVAVDGLGNVYVAGRTDGAFPGQTFSGVIDAFVRKYDSSGNEIWTKQFGSSARDDAGGVAVNGEGDVYVAGLTLGAFPEQMSSGDADVYLIKFGKLAPGEGIAPTRWPLIAGIVVIAIIGVGLAVYIKRR